MKKICFITPNSLPVPAVKGGAVETLVNNLIDGNEIEKEFEFTVISIYNKKAKELSRQYKNTKIKYIKVFLNDQIEKMKSKFDKSNLLHKIVRKVLYLTNKIYEIKAYKYVKDNTFDYIIIEGGNAFDYKKILDYYR